MNVTNWDGQMAVGPPGSSPGQQPLFPHVDRENSGLYHFLDQASAHPSYPCPPHTTHFHYSCSEPSFLHHSSPYQSFGPTLHRFVPNLTSIGSLQMSSRTPLALYCGPRVSSACSLRRRRAARAIEYNGLWIDEEELLNGLTEPEGKLTIHQCCWEEDRSPCLLWITGDKSRINAHIQRWHGWNPGGDKLQVDCRWSACGKMMLKESIARHIVNIHLGAMWECQGCGKDFVRNDVYGQHAAKSDVEACRTLGALITYSGDAREIDACTALQSGGRYLYASA
ncbi:hypothetical protein EV363DRAFT_1329536 [Boletus edulis]|nr:hypothetical protein EV363DRAFT_1329536 [Boletus edulis]